MTTPLVSIVTPTLNQAATIRETLRSVRDQTYARVEHIVVDGGSTDGTLQVLDAAARESPLIWKSEPDDGMYDAVNKGFAMASGEILGYVNSDDVLAPWAIETVVRAFDAQLDVGVAFGDAIELSPSGAELKLQVPFRPERIARYGSLVQPAVFWRRSVLDRSGAFDPSLQFVGDLEYWLRTARAARFTHIEEVLAAYLVHPTAKTSKHRVAMRREEMRTRGAYGARSNALAASNLAARLSQGVAVRRQMVRFMQSLRRQGDERWSRFRADGRPKVSLLGFVAALMPLAIRRRPTHWMTPTTGWIKARQESDQP